MPPGAGRGGSWVSGPRTPQSSQLQTPGGELPGTAAGPCSHSTHEHVCTHVRTCARACVLPSPRARPLTDTNACPPPKELPPSLSCSMQRRCRKVAAPSQPGSPRLGPCCRDLAAGSGGGSEVGGPMMGLRSQVQIQPIAGLRPPTTSPPPTPHAQARVHTHARTLTRMVLIWKTNTGL